ncbi:MAG: hypothetical protein CGU28_05100 [Candidatus Dactylopiibacterium carminicum]|uniref:Flagellar FleN n=1 Tax=Candidatus Dactylopiibacterium carminicum TaxID=857335 RepID=A0A272ETZ3_9RHOO|nr:hypothetical protein [Candidatus Dactylopiibacterium carminicum]KAF7599664.1 hypothetical protein BGI27_06730 [Candidatus Dactylopiibacterium carminicum]PAS93558.1 MAG: hypothetical protein CGU29_07095 [Candidatus Dactylopiibacterium carminicum]PAS97449.1 MAG: hypothetical protein CGU28_05100 [Candidatus Dactylopiibacterium carminicum]PAS99664.1 MAG: hypothetical protein BSR46_06765 [Candidatus Dactylopiibacterium carminicum]
MDALSPDQATGLRRLLQGGIPEVTAVLPCGRATTVWLAYQLELRASVGVRILVVDECLRGGGLSDRLGGMPRADLADWLEGLSPADLCTVSSRAGLEIVRAARLAESLIKHRSGIQRALAMLRSLQAGYDEWLLCARLDTHNGVSSLALAAPRMLLLLDADPRSATRAYIALRNMLRAGCRARLAVCVVGAVNAAANALLEGFASEVRERLGVDLACVGSLGEAAMLDSRAGSTRTDSYLTNLIQAIGRRPELMA